MSTGYRPTRSQQLLILSLIPKFDNETIVVHHVLVDSYQRLVVQVERRFKDKMTFDRVIL